MSTIPEINGIFISKDSFVGRYTIPYSASAWIMLQSVVDEWERKMIMKLLGVELGKLLIAYKEAQPNSDPPVVRYDDLIAPFDLQDNSFTSFPLNSINEIHSSLGIEDFLTACVYYQYVLLSQVKNSQSGFVKANVETSEVVSPIGSAKIAESKWNSALETVRAIQWFCQWKTGETTNENTYPEFAGQYIAPQYGSII